MKATRCWHNPFCVSQGYLSSSNTHQNYECNEIMADEIEEAQGGWTGHKCILQRKISREQTVRTAPLYVG